MKRDGEGSEMKVCFRAGDEDLNFFCLQRAQAFGEMYIENREHNCQGTMTLAILRNWYCPSKREYSK